MAGCQCSFNCRRQLARRACRAIAAAEPSGSASRFPLALSKRSELSCRVYARVYRPFSARLTARQRRDTLAIPRLPMQVRSACASGDQHIIVSYSRKEFLQTGEWAGRWRS